MSILTRRPFLPPALSRGRRSFLSGFGKFTLSATAIALLAGPGAARARRLGRGQDSEQRRRHPERRLGAEQEAIAAYQVGASSGLLQKPVLDLAVQFQGHHKEHAAALAATVKKLGGTPVEAEEDLYFPVEKLKTQADVLAFAAELEKGAVSAYLGAVPILDDRDLAKAAALHPGRRGDALGRAAPGLGKTPCRQPSCPDIRTPFTKDIPVTHLASSRRRRRSHLHGRRRDLAGRQMAIPFAARKSTSVAWPATRSSTIAAGRDIAACSVVRRQPARLSITRGR